MASTGDASAAILDANQRLLNAIAAGDYAEYSALCSADLTAFEPEAKGHLVVGLPFHKHYFDAGARAPKTNPPPPPATQTISSPHVRMLGDSVAVVSYVRLQQRVSGAGEHSTACSEETRVWELQQGRWVNVHMHRSACP